MTDRLAKFQRAYNNGGKLLEELLLSFGEKQQNRFLQNLPIRVSVWRSFAANPIQPVNLWPRYSVIPQAHAEVALRALGEIWYATLSEPVSAPSLAALHDHAEALGHAGDLVQQHVNALVESSAPAGAVHVEEGP